MLNFSGLRENLASFSFLSLFKNNMSLSRVYMDAKGQQNLIVLTRTSTALSHAGGGEWGLTKRCFTPAAGLSQSKDEFLPHFDITKTPAIFFLNPARRKLGNLRASLQFPSSCRLPPSQLWPEPQEGSGNKQTKAAESYTAISAKKNASLLATWDLTEYSWSFFFPSSIFLLLPNIKDFQNVFPLFPLCL